MNTGFPTANQSSFTGNAGVNLVSTIINNNFKWIFRPTHNEHDFGIDAYVDIVSENNLVTGQSIAMQIKSGDTFFKTKSPNGFTFYGEMKHLNYYMNMNSQYPVLIVICDTSESKCYWEKFDGNKIEKTKTGWKLNIPSNNILELSKKNKILKLLPPPKDYSDDLNHQWLINSLLKEFDCILYTIDKKDILLGNIKPARDFFDRLQINDDLFRSLQGKVELSIYGYDHDYRELFEIKEVREWFKKANRKIKPWFFFLNTVPPAYGFQLYWTCLCHAKVICNTKRMNSYEVIDQLSKGLSLPTLRTTFDVSLMNNFFEINFPRLNKITESLGMSLEENKAISYGIIDAIKLNNE
ncbi:MAG: DUF4365 and DUF1817 domain-containing protein [Methylobacter sp.]|nr:DUF4365 and DUF1817 domain-containing protein [Methylobacter sp.]